MSQSTADQNQIESDLGHTRARMDARLTELQGRLSPGQIVDDLMGYFRGSEGGDFARNLMESVRSNPMPAALTGIGLAWLMASNPNKRGQESDPATLHGNGDGQAFSAPASPAWKTQEEFDRHLSDAEQEVVRDNGEAEPAYRSRLEAARGKALGIARQTEDTYESFSQRVQAAIAAARQGVTQGAHDLRDRASDATSRATGAVQGVGRQLGDGGRAAQQMGNDLLSTITGNPVLLGAVGLAVGALLGAFVPQSDQEEAALGNMAGQARNAARDLAQNVVDRGGEVAQKTLDAGRDSARAHGLTPDKTAGTFVDQALSGELTDNVKQVAQEVLKAGDEAFHTTNPDHGDNPTKASAPGTSGPASTSGSTPGDTAPAPA